MKSSRYNEGKRKQKNRLEKPSVVVKPLRATRTDSVHLGARLWNCTGRMNGILPSDLPSIGVLTMVVV